MKTTPNILFSFLVSVAILPFVGCSTTETGASSLPYEQESEQIEYVEPLSEYVQDTEQTFRARGQAESTIPSVAKKAARMDAKIQLAEKIKTTIDAASKSHAGNAQGDSAIAAQTKFFEEAKAYVEQTLTGIHVLGEKLLREKRDSRYIAYVAMEIDKKAVAKAISDNVSQTTPEQKAQLRDDLEKVFSQK